MLNSRTSHRHLRYCYQPIAGDHRATPNPAGRMPTMTSLLPFSSPASRHHLPSSKEKKLHHPYPRSSTAATAIPYAIALICAVIAISSLAFAASVLRRPPRTVSVFRCGRAVDTFRTYKSKLLAAAGGGSRGEEIPPRPKLLGFIGVVTGFEAADRRAALRSTWFPPDPAGLVSSDRPTVLAFRFVIGRSKNRTRMAELNKEEEEYHDFVFLDVDEDAAGQPYKTFELFRAAFDLFDAEFYVKVSDNIYMRPDRLATVLAKERSHPRTYIGCMKKGPVITDPNSKWFERQGDLIGNEYFQHAYGPIYALSSEIVSALSAAKNESLRMFSNEDITIGSWMLAMNVVYEDIKALCEPQCTPTSVAVWDVPRCSGLCNPVAKLKELHNTTMCSKSPTVPPEDDEER